MNWGLSLRALVFLRRGVRALEQIAEAHKRIADVTVAEWEAKNVPRPRRKPVVTLFDQAEANRRYERLQEERMIDADEP